MKTLFIWKVRDELRSYIQEGLKQSEIEFVFPEDSDDQTLKKEFEQAEIVVGWRPKPEHIQIAEKLKLVINPGTGVNHHMSELKDIYKQKNIVLTNGHGNSYFTAQHAFALMMALHNGVIQHHQWMKDGKWRTGDKELSSIPLQNKTIGLLGYGHVNKQFHQFLMGFNVNVAILKSKWRSRLNVSGMECFDPSQMDAFLQASDVLVLGLPLTSQTKHIIGKKELEMLGENGMLINVGRGELIEEEALYQALKEKSIHSAAIDTWYEYQPEEIEGKKYPFSKPFHELDNMILSPHRAASPLNDLKRWDEVIENIKRFSEGSSNLLNKVDLEREY